MPSAVTSYTVYSHAKAVSLNEIYIFGRATARDQNERVVRTTVRSERC